MKTKAFTMIELVFVIVVLGILAAVALPKFAPVLDDAKFASGKSTLSSIRSAIVTERQASLIKGINSYPEILDDANTDVGEALFDGNATVSILTYPIYAKDTGGGWMKITDTDTTDEIIPYRYYISSTRNIDFEYDNLKGTFDCDHTEADCKELAE